MALASSVLLGTRRLARAEVPATIGMIRWGQGEYRHFGLLIYTATLWAGDNPLRPPLVLRLDYHRRIAGATIAATSLREMRRFVAEPEIPASWGDRMREVFPDVVPGDHLVGHHLADRAVFYQDGRHLGTIDLPGFAPAFFAIWLDPRTSAPALRAALLSRQDG
jgi:hypothetical protein